jgi:Fic-DOC domain mobile mystery protein B
MTDPLFEEDGDDAATPLTADEKNGLIPSYITLRRELNEAEQLGITAAEAWAFSRKRDVLDEAFLRRLHKQMFKEVWRWAGEFRTTPRNIGVDPWKIGPMLRDLVADTRYWVEQHTFPPDEIAARFHHRLVLIHLFPNGNGRHSRLATDLLLVELSQPLFTWGRVSLVNASETRSQYIAALRAADAHDIKPLLAFVRS